MPSTVRLIDVPTPDGAVDNVFTPPDETSTPKPSSASVVARLSRPVVKLVRGNWEKSATTSL
jgi:hypothetical protein